MRYRLLVILNHRDVKVLSREAAKAKTTHILIHLIESYNLFQIAVNETGQMALHVAVISGDHELVRFLLESKYVDI